MTTSFVIDTNVLTFAAGGHGDEEQTSHCAAIVFELMSNDDFAFALDTDEHIIEEYTNNLNRYEHPHTKIIQEYFEKELKTRDGISYHIPIDEDEVEELTEKGFHDEDLIFVRIAPDTDSETITSCDGESLIDDDYKEWIENEFDIEIHPPEDFREELKSY